jgi:3-methyl-2-oxobutanoate hydroxymethyltransferase
MERVTIAALQEMKRTGQKIVGVVVYDYQMAQIVDRAGVDLVSVGDSIGATLWGHRSELEVTLDQILIACKAVRRGVDRALVSCDMPYGPLQKGPAAAVESAKYLINEGGADILKLDAAADFSDSVRAVADAGIPIWPQFGVTPHTAGRYTGNAKSIPELVASLKEQFVYEALLLERLGAAMLDFTNSGSVTGPAVVEAVKIPVLGGLGGGPWLDGRVRAVMNAIGYVASALDDNADRYANVATIALEAVTAYAGDVRSGRQVRGK